MSTRSTLGDIRSRLPASADKASVILDIGNVYTRCGLAGDPAPRYIIKSQVTMKPYGQVQNVWDPKYINREELYLILCRFLQNIYLKYLMMNSKDHRVVVIESILCPTNFRNTLAKVLFNHLNVPHAAFVPSHLLCTFTLGGPTALVLDVGYKETTILPVYEGIPVVAAWQNTPYAAEQLYDNLKHLLQARAEVQCTETGEKKPLGAVQAEELINSSLEDITARTCFVRHKTQAEGKFPLPVTYPLNSKYKLLLDGYTRDHAANVLFEDSEDDQPIPAYILEALLKCPYDCRRKLSENILVVGGVAALPGFNYRLKQELESLASDKCQKYHTSLSALKFKFHNPPANPNCTAWLGGSIFGSSEVAVLERAVSREKFKENKTLPDWVSCDPDQRERFKSIPTRKLLPSIPASLRHSSVTAKTGHS